MQEQKIQSEEPTTEQELEQPRITTKERVLAARGLEVPIDYFLYSCLERERLVRATEKLGTERIHWPLLPVKGRGEETDPPPAAEVAATELPGLIARLVGWYRENYGELANTKVLDYEQLSEVVPGFVAMHQDLARLYQAKNGEAVPDFEKAAGSNRYWDDVSQALRDSFPTYQHLFLRYMQWTYATEKKEEFVPGSRPPVGRYAPPPLPRTGGRFDRPQGGRDGRGGGRGGRPERGTSHGERPERHERPEAHAPEASLEAGDGPAPQMATAPQNQDRGPRGRDHGRPERNGGGERGGRPPRGEGRGRRPDNDEATQKQTATVVAEVESAIAELKSNPAVADVTLKPTNSFYRRIQHQQIVDAGFHSFSVGEGPDRAVKVARKEG